MGPLDPLLWRAVNDRLRGLLGQPVERANEFAGLLSGTVPPNEFLALRSKQVAESMQPEEMMNNFAGSGLLGMVKKSGVGRYAGPTETPLAQAKDLFERYGYNDAREWAGRLMDEAPKGTKEFKHAQEVDRLLASWKGRMKE